MTDFFIIILFWHWSVPWTVKEERKKIRTHIPGWVWWIWCGKCGGQCHQQGHWRQGHPPLPCLWRQGGSAPPRRADAAEPPPGSSQAGAAYHRNLCSRSEEGEHPPLDTAAHTLLRHVARCTGNVVRVLCCENVLVMLSRVVCCVVRIYWWCCQRYCTGGLPVIHPHSVLASRDLFTKSSSFILVMSKPSHSTTVSTRTATPQSTTTAVMPTINPKYTFNTFFHTTKLKHFKSLQSLNH